LSLKYKGLFTEKKINLQAVRGMFKKTLGCLFWFSCNMKKIVFISGPILGMENNQRYREKISDVLVKLGFDVINPWLREKILYKGDEKCWWDKDVTL
jgi:hypothetical protein